MQHQETVSHSGSTHEPLTFRILVDMLIVFGCIPALVLNIVLWAIATTFPHAGLLPSILTLIVTLLLAFIAIVVLVRYVDIAVMNAREVSASTGLHDDEVFMKMFGAGAICLFLAISIVVCLSTAGTLEGWHYTLMAVEVLLVGYQTWRTFLGHSD